MAVNHTSHGLIRIAPIVKCPTCKATGAEYSLRHHKLVNCSMCAGFGWITLAICKGCGHPATTWWPLDRAPIVQYCGVAACLKLLVTLHKPSKPSDGIVVNDDDEDAEIARMYM